MDLTRRKPAVDHLFAGYGMMTCVVWIVRGRDLAVAPVMVIGHLLVALVLLLIPAPGDRSRRWVVLARSLYPFLMWAWTWWEIGWLFDATAPAVQDSKVMAMDLAVFGAHWNLHLAGMLPWLGDLMGFCYLSYYLLILSPPLVLALTRRLREFQQYIAVLMATYLTCFLVYMVFPVLGPRGLPPAAAHTVGDSGGVFAPLMDAFFAAGDSLGTAFPSSHCAGSVVTALLVGLFFGRRAGNWAAVWAALIVMSTVYTNNHYAIDAAAGVALAFLTSGMGRRFAAWKSKVPSGVSSNSGRMRVGTPATVRIEGKRGLS